MDAPPSDQPLISDAAIAAMTPQQRRELIWRLTRTSSTGLSPRAVARIRARRLTLAVTSVVLLIPWIGYLAATLPERYVARNWAVAWVGFDVLLVAMFAATALLGLLRRQLLILAAFGTGILLICDAWFDVLTAAPGDRWFSIASAVLIELPIAALLLTGPLRLLRLIDERFWLLEPDRPLWSVRLPLVELFAPAAEPETAR